MRSIDEDNETMIGKTKKQAIISQRGLSLSPCYPNDSENLHLQVAEGANYRRRSLLAGPSGPQADLIEYGTKMEAGSDESLTTCSDTKYITITIRYATTREAIDNITRDSD